MAGHESSTLAFFLPRLGQGGIGRNSIRLMREFLRRGHPVDLLHIEPGGPLWSQLPEGVRLIRLPNSNPFTVLLPLTAYLNRTRPAGIKLLHKPASMAATALRARRIARCDTRIILSIHNPPSAVIGADRRPKQKQALYRKLQRSWSACDALVAVSQDVADDVSRHLCIHSGNLRVINNPVIDDLIFRRAEAPPPHPWLKEEPAVLVAAARLSPQKDLETLLRAVAIAAQQRPLRLLILGEGPQRHHLESLISTLGLAEAVELPGFVENPYPYIKHASLVPLASRWDGFGNILVEALALGTPVVSTDCPGGPRQILQDGRYGRLVPVGDPAALADAILDTLDNPLPCNCLKEAAEPYTIRRIARQYLAAFSMDEPA
jgi:glycosyltransferase involved in cell wall biosynthesis